MDGICPHREQREEWCLEQKIGSTIRGVPFSIFHFPVVFRWTDSRHDKATAIQAGNNLLFRWCRHFTSIHLGEHNSKSLPTAMRPITRYLQPEHCYNRQLRTVNTLPVKIGTTFFFLVAQHEIKTHPDNSENTRRK